MAQENKIRIDITKYVHVDEIYWGQECKSSYNHNYYYSEVLGDVILEECDDDGYFVAGFIEIHPHKGERF